MQPEPYIQYVILYVCIYTYMWMCMYIYTHIYVYANIHTQRHQHLGLLPYAVITIVINKPKFICSIDKIGYFSAQLQQAEQCIHFKLEAYSTICTLAVDIIHNSAQCFASECAYRSSACNISLFTYLMLKLLYYSYLKHIWFFSNYGQIELK